MRGWYPVFYIRPNTPSQAEGGPGNEDGEGLESKLFESCSLCRRHDKVIIFSDVVFALRTYAQKLQR